MTVILVDGASAKVRERDCLSIQARFEQWKGVGKRKSRHLILILTQID